MLMARSAPLDTYAAAARAVGLDPVAMIAEVGLPPAAMSDPDLLIPAQSIGVLLAMSVQRSGRADFGLIMAEGRTPSNLGLLGEAMRGEANVRGALTTLIRHLRYQNESLSARLEEVEDVAIVRIHLADMADAGPIIMELVLAGLTRILRRLIGKPLTLQAVEFEHAASSDLAVYQRCFGLTPTFRSSFNGLVVSVHDLDIPIPSTDAATSAHPLDDLNRAAQRHPPDLVFLVRERLVAGLSTGGGSVDEIAADLGLTRRTLHRRLAQQDCTFRGLLHEERVRAAETYRAAGHSLTEVAELIGFSSLSAFSHWRRGRLT